MMPVATPPNAIVYGSGHVRIGQMVRGGFVLNIVGIVLVTLFTYLAAVVFDIPLGRTTAHATSITAPPEAP
jgi:sodium-dependent dicarboxylate transporter 2/3/5